mgnify:CR=1 FL=1
MNTVNDKVVVILGASSGAVAYAIETPDRMSVSGIMICSTKQGI